MIYPDEYILQMGYFPDSFATRDLPPDQFFIHVVGRNDYLVDGGARAFRDAVDDLITACRDKYRLDMGGPYSRAFDIQDCFWSVSLRPTESEQPGGGAQLDGAMPEYAGADETTDSGSPSRTAFEK